MKYILLYINEIFHIFYAFINPTDLSELFSSAVIVILTYMYQMGSNARNSQTPPLTTHKSSFIPQFDILFRSTKDINKTLKDAMYYCIIV